MPLPASVVSPLLRASPLVSALAMYLRRRLWLSRFWCFPRVFAVLFSLSVIAINACGRYHVDLLGLTRTLTVQESKSFVTTASTQRGCLMPRVQSEVPRQCGDVSSSSPIRSAVPPSLGLGPIPGLLSSGSIRLTPINDTVTDDIAFHKWLGEWTPIQYNRAAFVLQAAAVENVDSEAVGRPQHSRERRSFSLSQVE